MAYIDKLLNKFNKAKSAVNSIKGIASKIQSINYETTIDSLGLAQEEAEKYIEARRKALTDSIDSSQNSAKTIATKDPAAKIQQLVYPYHETLDNYLLFKIRPRRTRGGFTGHPVHAWRSVALYVPDAVISQAAVQYRNEGSSTFTRGAMNLMDNLVSAKSAGDIFSKENGEVVKKMGTKFLQNAANLATGGLRNLKFGRAANPLQEQMLDGIPFRSWDFTFDFWPKSAKEAEEVNKIIYTFRSSMLPDAYNESFDFAAYDGLTDEDSIKERFSKINGLGSGKETGKDGDTNSSYFNYPNVFEISFYGKMGNKVDGFLPAVCTNAQVDYTGGQKFSTFADGQPVHIQLTLNFLEIKTMTLGNYEKVRDPNSKVATQGSMFDNASKGEYLDSENALGNLVRGALPDKFQGQGYQPPTNIKPYPQGDNQIDTDGGG